MRKAVCWLFAGVVVLHGLIHLLGVVEGFGLADVEQLTRPVGAGAAALWLIAALAVLGSVTLMVRRVRGWWILTATAGTVSQLAILTSWADAKAGTAVNIVMLLAAGYGYAATGPHSLRSGYRREVNEALADQAASDRLVTEDDLAGLPGPVAAYVRRSGAVGRPAVTGFQATVHGRIRGGPEKPWMTFTGEQVNTYGENPHRVFYMDATMRGLPVDVLHCFGDQAATMRVKLASLVPIVNASGADLTRAETVTLFNDLCIMAPAALLGAPITWHPVDRHRTRGTFTCGEQTVAADLVFDAEGDLILFTSDDRLRSSADGRSFTRQRWSTPVSDYTTHDGRRLASRGTASWHAPDPEGTFDYLEFHLDDITYLTGRSAASQAPEARTSLIGGRAQT